MRLAQLLFSCLAAVLLANSNLTAESFPSEVRDIRVRSTLDGSSQPAFFYAAKKKNMPLVVSLHTWSGGYEQTGNLSIAQWCIERGWSFIQPHFRGANRNPNACGSELAVCDVEDAVQYAKQQVECDPDRVYLVGASGGGHMALLMAGRAPQLWAGVSAWVPIFDLAAWQRECTVSKRRYAAEVVASCGGLPGSSSKVDEEYRRRSPLSWLAAARGVSIDINAGIRDGHDGSVPISHTLLAFNELAAPEDRLSVETISFMTKQAKVPQGVSSTDLADASYGDKQPLFRRSSGRARMTIFQGGHEMINNAAILWLEKQRREKRPAAENLRVLSGDERSKLFDSLLRQCSALDAKRAEALQKAAQSKSAMAAHVLALRKQLKTLIGDFPEKTPLNAEVTGTLSAPGYRVEKVVFESLPRHRVSALFYLPAKGEGPWPGVLFACGHSANGKAYAAYQTACALLAQNGFAVLSYDPISQGERVQLPKAPRFGTSTHTLLNSGARLVGRSVVWYQAWDGVRSIDYLLSRPEVDHSKPIGMTGTSGGGTQTNFLMALDDRIGPAAPSCYVMTRTVKFASAHGPADGCQHLPGEGRSQLDHIDYSIMRAPRPTSVLAATNDFFDINATRKTVKDAALAFDVLENAERFRFFEANATHGMHVEHRQEAVRWMRRWLYDDPSPVVEPKAIKVFADKEIQATRTGQVATSYDDDLGVGTLNLIRAVELNAQRKEGTKLSAEAFNDRVRSLLGIKELTAPRILREGRIERTTHYVDRLLLDSTDGFPIPALLFSPKRTTEDSPATLWLDGEGKESQAKVGGAILALVDAGQTVLAIDVRGVGETRDQGSAGKYYDHDHRVQTVALHLGRPLLGQRVEDTLSAAAFLRSLSSGTVRLRARGSLGPVALHAALLDSSMEVQIENSISSWVTDLVAKPLRHNVTQHVVPKALLFYDLPDLVDRLRARGRWRD